MNFKYNGILTSSDIYNWISNSYFWSLFRDHEFDYSKSELESCIS